jgi:hypothetical protein
MPSGNSHYGQNPGKTGGFRARQTLKWPYQLALGWLWGCFGVPLYSQVDGFVVALGSHGGGFGVLLSCLVYA